MVSKHKKNQGKRHDKILKVKKEKNNRTKFKFKVETSTHNQSNETDLL